MIFADEYADSVSLPKMLETGNFWMQLEVLFSKVWNGDDVTTLVQQLDETIAGQVGGTNRSQDRLLLKRKGGRIL